MNLKTLTVFVIAALAAVSVVTAAHATPDAKKPLTGIWTGKTHQDLEPLGDEADFVEWEQRITVTALRGRLVSLATNLRYTCPDDTNPMAGDIRLYLSWSTLRPKERGPLLTKNGGFALNVTHVKDFTSGRDVRLPMPVHISGVLGATGASGRLHMAGGGCAGKGNWLARRTSSR